MSDYTESPFGRALSGAPRGEYLLRLRPQPVLRPPVDGADDRWSNPAGPYFGEA